MEWEAPAIVLDARPYAEADAVATVMTEAGTARRPLGAAGPHMAHGVQPGDKAGVTFDRRGERLWQTRHFNASAPR